jgi:hypothetical protein
MQHKINVESDSLNLNSIRLEELLEALANNENKQRNTVSPLPPVITGFSLVNFVVSGREEQFFFKLPDVYYI